MDAFDLALYLVIANATVGLVVMVNYLLDHRKE